MKRKIQIAFIAILITFFIGPANVVEAQPVYAQAALIQLAAENPGKHVAVIVQKADSSVKAEQQVQAFGGRITKNLHIIKAFVAEITARQAVTLTRQKGVRWVSLDAAVERTGKPAPPPTSPNTYLDTLGVPAVQGLGLNGTGIGVAIVDSGISSNQDISVQRSITFNANSTSVQDYFGHGTHVAGIVAGDGDLSAGYYQGVAPGVILVSLKVCDETGMAYESDVVEALQWIYENKAQYNLRVVNISLNTTLEQSYHTSPLDAAAEILWFNGIVVVVSSGNADGSGFNYAGTAPANDPFVITAGATEELGNSNYNDDVMAAYTAWAVTFDGYLKPDILAPGSNIISVLSTQSEWDVIAPDRVVANNYFRLSGTSMAAPMVTGAAALLLQDEPYLTPDQVKYRLLHATDRFISATSETMTASFPYLDVYATVTGTSTESANMGIAASQLLWTGSDPITWGSVAWNSVAWNSVAWNSVAWNSVAWNSVAWNSLYWGP